MNRKNSHLTPCRSNWTYASVVIFAAIVVVRGPSVADAHGVVGDRIFLSPIVGNDAFPDNALNLATHRSDYQFSLTPAFEKQLSNNSSLLFTGEWERITPGAGQHASSGSADLSIYFRQAAYVSVEHELELTVSPILILPVGSRQIADQGYTHLGGEVLLGKGFGDLPDSQMLKFLRPFAVQAEAGYTGRIQGPANSDVFGNFELEYSLRYLDHFVEHLNIGRPWVDFMPYVQFNYAQSFIASRLTTSPDFRLTPGIAYLGDYCEVSVGAQIALNGAAQSGDRVAVVGLVEIFYDDIFPVLNWNLF
jgi:hypothetical protein